MPQFVAKHPFRFRGRRVERGQSVNVEGFDSNTIASLLDQGLVNVAPQAADNTVVYVRWDGEQYPPRPEGDGLVIFQGPEEPEGQEEFDIWIDTSE
jgi:hypothetical protein